MELLIQTLALGVLLGAVLALAASGLTLIFGVMDVINIAQGAFLILASFMAWTLWSQFGIDPLASAFVLTPVLFLIGLAVYAGTLQWIRDAPTSMTVILTFALAILLEGLMGFIWGNTSHSVTPPYFTQSFAISGISLPKGQVFGGLAAIVVLSFLYLFLKRSWFGRAIRAAAVNPDAARLSGIDIKRISALTFAFGIATTGAAGAIISVLSPFLPGSHGAWISRLLGVIVLGGMGSLPGAVVGALIIGVAETLTATYVSLHWAAAVPYIVIFVVLLLRPQGLLGTRLREDVA